jgi:hypothetical protein
MQILKWPERVRVADTCQWFDKTNKVIVAECITDEREHSMAVYVSIPGTLKGVSTVAHAGCCRKCFIRRINRLKGE